jgi:hypothetical protein
MKQVIVAVVLVLSASSAFATGRWCTIGTAMVKCPMPPVTHAHDVVSNLHVAMKVR